jgi:hypothetical protein
MGWRGVLRSMAAYSRASRRDALRRHNQYARQQQYIAKVQAIEQARQEVEEYENYIDLIQTLHKDTPEIYDWIQIAKTQTPPKPEQDKRESNKLLIKLNKFKPNFLHKLFKLENRARKRKEKKYQKAFDKEKAELAIRTAEWEKKAQEIAELVELANGINSGKIEYYKKLYDDENPFEELSSFGSKVEISFKNGEKAVAQIFLRDDSIVPKHQKTQLKTGKLSIKDLPAGRRNEIYQDHIASAVLHVGRVIFGLLPLNELVVNAKCKMVNTATGKLEFQTMLSVKLLRETMDSINFDGIDPSDCMKNFLCNMNFKKTLGMGPVQALAE